MKTPAAFTESPPEGCLSHLVIDTLLAGELDQEQETKARQHLQTCRRCTQQFNLVQQAQQRFSQRSAGFIPERRRDKRWRLLAAPLVAAAAACVAMLFWFEDDRSKTQLKGHPTLGFYVKHEGATRVGGPGERVVPGDQLRFTVTTHSPQYLAVVSVDGAGKPSVYYPMGPEMAHHPAGPQRALELATELDETLGKEVVYGFFCADKIALSSLIELVGHPPVVPPEGCHVEVLEIVKVPHSAP